jgi:hypothetical protein
VLIDTNTSLRILREGSPTTQDRDGRRSHPGGRGEELCIVPQNLIEIWTVATRPVEAKNGLGLNTEEAVHALQTRFAAAMMELGQTSILTFNTEDFKRYPGIEAVHPAKVTEPRR